MDKREYLRLKRLKKQNDIEDANRNAIRVYCKHCGHTNSLPAWVDSAICHWCNHKVINNTKAHFMWTMRNINKEVNNDL